MTKKELTLEVIERLRKEYPDADCTLDYNEAWKLLISVRLAAQCTDARVNVVVQDLYAQYPDINAVADAPVEKIEEIVRPCGLGKSNARDISACMKILRDEYGGQVPDDFDALLTCHCDRHALYSSGKQNRYCGWHQGAEKSRDGALETGAAGRGEQFLPPSCLPWAGCLYSKNKAVL